MTNGIFSVRASCGAETYHTRRRSKDAPYRPLCRCSQLWSSDPICHRCSCVACADARAAWLKSIAAGGILGEMQREKKRNAK